MKAPIRFRRGRKDQDREAIEPVADPAAAADGTSKVDGPAGHRFPAPPLESPASCQPQFGRPPARARDRYAGQGPAPPSDLLPAAGAPENAAPTRDGISGLPHVASADPREKQAGVQGLQAAQATQAAQAPRVWPTIACHVGQVPAFARTALAGLYAHVYASLEYFEVFKPLDGLSTLVVRDAAGICALLVFRTHGARAEVFNEFFGIDATLLQPAVDEIFARFPGLDLICFRNLVSAPRRLSQPYQCHKATEDYLLQLPDSVEAYTESLGKSTRRNIRRYHARLIEAHPSFALRFDAGAAIDDAQVAVLLAMSRDRIHSQGKTFSVDAGYARAMTGLTRRCGFVAIATIEGQVCAGLVCYRIGDGFVAKVVAHDARYDDYGLGTLCYYLTICEAIRRGGRLFNLGTQRYEYKERLLGLRRDLEHLTVYRSRWRQLLHAQSILQMAADRRLHQVKLWLQARQSQQTGGVARIIAPIGWRMVRAARALHAGLRGRR